MEIFLSKQCESLTGSLGRGFGYVVVKRGNRFFSQRCNNKVSTPPNGHLRFILSCANLAQSKLHITDIRVSRCEFMAALIEAGYTLSGARDIRHELSASDIINYRRDYLPNLA